MKRLFIDRRYKKAEHPEDYVFIAANVYDNHALMAHDPDYVRMLENLPEEQRRAWLLGQWDIFEGQYFAEFDRNVHVCRPYGIPAHWRRYVTLDYGMDMLAALWVAVDEQGRAVVYRELYEGRDNGKGENGQGHIISAAARRLLEVNGGDEVQAWLAPPDLWNRRRTREKARRSCFGERRAAYKDGNSRVADGWRCGNFWAPGRADRRGWRSHAGVSPRSGTPVLRKTELKTRRRGRRSRAGASPRGAPVLHAKTELKTRRRGAAKPRNAPAGEHPARLSCSETETEAPQASGPAFAAAAHLRHLRKPDPHAARPAARRTEAGGRGGHAPRADPRTRTLCAASAPTEHGARPEAAVHDILRDDEKAHGGTAGQGREHRVI